MAVNKFDNSMLDAGMIGTTANKLLQMDGSAKIPAVDGSLLTGIPSAFTKSASDPAIATNPSGGVGTIWVNTTSGETYCCTDATAGANVWTNVGAGSGDVASLYQGSQYGFTSGSGDPTSLPAGDAIEKFSFTSDGNATDHANCSALRAYTGGHSSATYGYISGGEPAHYIEKFPFASQTNGTNIGYLSTGDVTRDNSSTTSDTNYGYTQGGSPPFNVIDRFPYSSDSNASDVGDLLAAGYGGGGSSSISHGYIAGGYHGSETNVIQKFAFGSSANSTDVADLTNTRYNSTGSQSGTHGYMCGGYGSSAYITNSTAIQKYSYASDANATNVGTTTVGRSMAGSHSSTTHGYASAGSGGSNGNVIEKYSYATDGNATDVGDLVISRGMVAGQHW